MLQFFRSKKIITVFPHFRRNQLFKSNAGKSSPNPQVQSHFVVEIDDLFGAMAAQVVDGGWNSSALGITFIPLHLDNALTMCACAK